MAKNPVFYARTKDVEVYYHFIKEKVPQDEVEMQYGKTNNQVAYLFIKSLSTRKFEKFCQQLNMDRRMKVDVEGEC